MCIYMYSMCVKPAESQTHKADQGSQMILYGQMGGGGGGIGPQPPAGGHSFCP